MKKIFFVYVLAVAMIMLGACKNDANNNITNETSISDTAVSGFDTNEAGNGNDNVSVDENREDEFSVSEDLLSVTLGKYEQDLSKEGTEPIEWIVLETRDDKALVISKYIIDCKPYNQGFADAAWETSSIRAWLNSDFYNTAFNQGERDRIVKSMVYDFDIEGENEAETETSGNESESEAEVGENAGNNNETSKDTATETAPEGTEDYIFLLSDFELEKYLADDENREGDEAYSYATEYAISQGVWTLSREMYDLKDYKAAGIPETSIGAGWWWLRTNGDKTSKALDVDTDGNIRVNGHDVGECHDGVRPAMWITIN